MFLWLLPFYCLRLKDNVGFNLSIQYPYLKFNKTKVAFLNYIFISIAKLYTPFYKSEDEQWFYFPLMIITSVFTIDIMCISFLFIDIPFYFYLILILITALILHSKFKKISYYNIIETKISLKKRILIYILIIINFSLMFFLLKYIRDNNLI